jgi:hypothetical protein
VESNGRMPYIFNSTSKKTKHYILFESFFPLLSPFGWFFIASSTSLKGIDLVVDFLINSAARGRSDSGNDSRIILIDSGFVAV